MIDDLNSTIHSYWDFYGRFLRHEWEHITPMKYGCLLIGIAFVGWLMMKGGR